MFGLGRDYLGRQEVDGKGWRDANRQKLCWIWDCFSQVREVNGAKKWACRGREILGWRKLWTAKTTAPVDTKRRPRRKTDDVQDACAEARVETDWEDRRGWMRQTLP